MAGEITTLLMRLFLKDTTLPKEVEGKMICMCGKMVSGFSAAAFGQFCGQETPPGAAAALGNCMDRVTSSRLFPARCGGMHGCCSGLQKKCRFLKMRKGNVDSVICLAKKKPQDFDNTICASSSH